jgi:N-acetylneuraminate synthase/N,N'-diacetyllegionaminate synthase
MMRRLVAEIGSCNGDLALAIDTAQAAVEAGAWMVKGQMYQADRLTTRYATSYGHGSIKEPITQYQAFEKALTYDQWAEVAAKVPGQFFASVFDLEAVKDYPWDWIKVASADITYRQLIEAAASNGASLIVSTGAATRQEVMQMLSWLPGRKLTLMACTLSYPTAPIDAHVARVITMRDLKQEVGYSDHTTGTAAARLAFDLGATMVEKHLTITPGQGGDHDFAITPWDIPTIVNPEPVSDAIAMIYGGSPIIGVRLCEQAARDKARRSIHAAVDIPPGTMLTMDLLAVLRPADGMEPWMLDHPDGPLGKHTSRWLRAGEAITKDTFHL